MNRNSDNQNDILRDLGATTRMGFEMLRNQPLGAQALQTLRRSPIINDQLTKLKATMLRPTKILLLAIAGLWLIEAIDLVQPWLTFDWYGIHPRTLIGLPGILLAPFLHAGFGHLLANTVPLFILGWLVLLRRRQDLLIVSLTAIIVSGLGVWLFGGSNTVHIGASGVIFGLLGYLLARGYFERSVAAILLAVLAFFLYGGMVWGVLPGRDGVSWLAHLFGLIGGVAAAYLLTHRPNLSAVERR